MSEHAEHRLRGGRGTNGGSDAVEDSCRKDRVGTSWRILPRARQIHIGRVTDEYFHHEDGSPGEDVDAAARRCGAPPRPQARHIIAHRDELGFEPPLIKVQVKSSERSVGDPAVSALYGKVSHEEYGLFVALGSFTAQAKSFARSKSNLRLIDGDELVELIFRHYERFDSDHRALLAMKRVCVPQRPEDAE